MCLHDPMIMNSVPARDTNEISKRGRVRIRFGGWSAAESR